ncbi:DUF262 domain-containing protein [Phyllobacterium sp. 21LDTY02-6]|uniref:DUF262 domain-containing protein n=1 Tax=Phyllobacterium sp. 21LDTY02-6 TaxID=2944903 RepID=UPI00202041B8|nr:DUF262 domain-containing protein [Phyllobacterium sp. 21LDTY02-6]MCO4317320.1 DUF262 domain-containing protein [Phyllobacterium sp. 21LDTY02-6]
MSNLQVSEINVPGVIKKLKSSEWLSPLFQRDFVWSNASVVSLVNSIIDARPVGMITLWEQEGTSALPLEPISIADAQAVSGKSVEKYFGDPQARPGRYYAILDGRQRSTALALAFGGLRASSGKFRNSGRYFLDVTATENTERVKFISEKDVTRRQLNILKIAVSNGLFPLEVEDPDAIFDQWMSYLQHIRNPDYYSNGVLPEEVELQRRNRILQSAFNGIIKTKIALYTVPPTYDLAEICDIFETLNTTGTKVSTVDLIHSNIYSDTVNDSVGPILIRDSIDELGELDGAIGWASSKERPELIAQFAAAMHVALDSKPETRPIGTKEYRISSIKSQDLLALPAKHWRKVFDESSKFAGFMGAFQLAVAGGHFTMAQCPYPAVASIYVALRWFYEFDRGTDVEWNPTTHLDPIFRAFFWRNALATRYDQGFLTQIGTDIRSLKTFLSGVRIGDNYDAWKASANAWLDENVAKSLDRESLFEIVTDGSEAGALKRASVLLLYSRAGLDAIDGATPIQHGSGQLQLHHIYPKDWCANNNFGKAGDFIDMGTAKRDYVGSAANLMPMARASNLSWRKKHPAQFIKEESLSFDSRANIWNAYFINRDCFEALESPDVDPGKFWELRGQAIATEIAHRMMV